ncbi:MAG: GNAT family N-acetyltransferase [Paracoccaceae bacterium]
METLTVRRAALPDLAELDALCAASYPRLLAKDYPPSLRVTAIPVLARAQPGLIGSGRYFVAEDADGAIRGAGGWSGRPGAKAAEVRHLFTDWRMTRRGIARTVMGHVFADARKAGFGRIGCHATRTAVPFYVALGFRPEGEVVVPLLPGIGFPVVRMDRTL